MNEQIFFGIDAFFLSYFLLLNSFYIFLLILTNPVLFRRNKETRIKTLYQELTFDVAPPVSIIIPTYNEQSIIISSITAALQVDLPHCFVIVVDDGSTDETLSLLINTYQLISVPPAVPSDLKTALVKRHYRSTLHPNLTIIHKENGGREDAINAGINACTTPFFVGIDADSFIEPSAIAKLMQHLLTKRDIYGMGGTLCIINGCKIEEGTMKKIDLPSSFLGKMQIIEYLRTFFFGRLGWNKLNGSYLISGGFGLFRKKEIVEIGGFKPVLAGDLDITVMLHKKMHEMKQPYGIDYVFDAIVWTDVPQSYSALANQRKRWHSSIMDICWRYKHMLFNPKYGFVGFFHIPYLLLGEGLAPLIEGLGYLYIIFCYAFGVLNMNFFWYFILIAWGVNMFLTLASLIMQEFFLKKYVLLRQILQLFIFSLIENFTYRPLTVWWRIQGFFRFFTKRRFMREKVQRSLK